MTDSDFAKAILALADGTDDAMDFPQKVTDLCEEYRNQLVEAPAQRTDNSPSATALEEAFDSGYATGRMGAPLSLSRAEFLRRRTVG